MQVLDLVIGLMEGAVPEEEEIAAVRTMLAEKHRTDALRSNSFWMFWLLDGLKAWHLTRGLRLADADNAETLAAWVDNVTLANATELERTRLDKITAAGLAHLKIQALDPKRCVALTLIPETTETAMRIPQTSDAKHLEAAKAETEAPVAIDAAPVQCSGA